MKLPETSASIEMEANLIKEKVRTPRPRWPTSTADNSLFFLTFLGIFLGIFLRILAQFILENWMSLVITFSFSLTIVSCITVLYLTT